MLLPSIFKLVSCGTGLGGRRDAKTSAQMPHRRRCTEARRRLVAMAMPIATACTLRSGSPVPSGRTSVSRCKNGCRPTAVSTSSPPGPVTSDVDILIFNSRREDPGSTPPGVDGEGAGSAPAPSKSTGRHVSSGSVLPLSNHCVREAAASPFNLINNVSFCRRGHADSRGMNAANCDTSCVEPCDSDVCSFSSIRCFMNAAHACAAASGAHAPSTVPTSTRDRRCTCGQPLASAGKSCDDANVTRCSDRDSLGKGVGVE